MPFYRASMFSVSFFKDKVTVVCLMDNARG